MDDFPHHHASAEKQGRMPVDRLRERLCYDPKTGNLYWRKREGDSSPFNANFAGKIAGSTNKGYRVVRIAETGTCYLAHRIAWAMYYGQWPDHEIDHIDKNGINNRIDNLRRATHRENMCNRSMKGTVPYKGVGYRAERSRFIARITVHGKTRRAGSFTDPVSAARAYDRAALEYHGEYAATNVKLGLLEPEDA